MTDRELAEQLLAVVRAVRSDLQALIDGAVDQCGGGVVGALQAEVQFAHLYARRAELDMAIAAAAERLGTNRPAT